MKRIKEKHIELLNECCTMRGNPTQLIHRTLHEFDWFVTVAIFGPKSKYPEARKEEQRAHDFCKVRKFRYDGDNTLAKEIELFHAWCKIEYKD